MSASELHVVVLAAGKGSRLGDLGADRPKWLLDVGGRSIAERQLAAVERARRDGVPIGEVTVVTGHAAGAIGSFLEERSQNGVATLHNPHYADINNWYSVLLALREIPTGDGGPRIVIVNGDLYADPDWVAAFLAASAETAHHSLIGIDLERRLTDESMKVAVGDDPARVTSIGKVGVDDPAGEYVGLLMAGGAVLREMRDALEAFVGVEAHVDEWYERAVGLTAARGVPWTVWPTPNGEWVEIDDDEDLRQACELATAVSR